ncbi:hypothetical protein JCM21900_006148 [Sporobolomyces salmonicolor]
MVNSDTHDLTSASKDEVGRDGGIKTSSSGASGVVETPDQWGLLLSFDDVAIPPVSPLTPSTTFRQNFEPRESSAPAASPLSLSFAPSPLSASASSLSPAFNTSSISPVHPSTSITLDAAVSILNSPSTSMRESVSPAPTLVDAPTLYVSLESAAARLKLPPSCSSTISDTACVRAAPIVDASCLSSRPKRAKSSKAETSHSSSSTTSEAGKVKPRSKAAASKKKKHGEDHIPRAPNAWICYRSARLKQLTERGNAPTRQSDVSKLIATMWRQETPEVREQYVHRATREAEAHAEKYPGYCYKPKRRDAGAQGDNPRRKVTKARTAEGRKRAQTTSAADITLSDWALSPVPNDPRGVDGTCTRLPSPSISETPTIASYDFDVGAFLASLDGCPLTPSTCSSSSFDFGTSTLPPSPASDSTDAWDVFQSASPTTFDSSFPAESSSSCDAFPVPPYSAPASLASFDFDFTAPPPLFDAEPPADSTPNHLSLSSQQCAPSALESYTFPPAPLPATPLSSYGENLQAAVSPTDL